MSDNETISLGPCPTCGGPVQHISDDGVRVDYRHVDLSTVRLERFREIAIDALHKITGEPNYNPSDLLQHGAVTAPAMQVQVAELLRILGLGDHARPESPAAVVWHEVIPALRELRDHLDKPYGQWDPDTLRRLVGLKTTAEQREG